MASHRPRRHGTRPAVVAANVAVTVALLASCAAVLYLAEPTGPAAGKVCVQVGASGVECR